MLWNIIRAGKPEIHNHPRLRAQPGYPDSASLFNSVWNVISTQGMIAQGIVVQFERSTYLGLSLAGWGLDCICMCIGITRSHICAMQAVIDVEWISLQAIHSLNPGLCLALRLGYVGMLIEEWKLCVGWGTRLVFCATVNISTPITFGNAMHTTMSKRLMHRLLGDRHVKSISCEMDRLAD